MNTTRKAGAVGVRLQYRRHTRQVFRLTIRFRWMETLKMWALGLTRRLKRSTK